MTEVLSQDEMDQLLNAINAGDTEPEVKKPVTDKRKIKIYDFERPDLFYREQIRTISMIHDVFARLSTTSLTTQLRSMVHVHVASVDQLTYEEFNRSIPTPTTLAVINMEPLNGNVILEIDPAITFSIIDRLLGGPGGETKAQHELTDIEANIMEGVIVRLLGNLREAWSHVIDLQPSLGQIETNPQFAQIVSPSSIEVNVTMETKVGDVEGVSNFYIPYITIEPIFNKLFPRYSYLPENIITPSKLRKLVNREDMPVKLTAEILRRDYTLEEINAWK